jgi:hypothetical protein
MRVNIRGHDQDRKGWRLEKISPAGDPVKVEAQYPAAAGLGNEAKDKSVP